MLQQSMKLYFKVCKVGLVSFACRTYIACLTTLEGNNKVYETKTHKQLRCHEKYLDLDIFLALGLGIRGLKWSPRRKKLIQNWHADSYYKNV